MTDRRRAPRYQLCRTPNAHVGLLQDVLIQSAAGDDVIVLTSTLPRIGERLVMQLVRANGEVASLGSELVRTAPVVHDGIVRFRLHLRVAGFAEVTGLNAPSFPG